MAIYEYRCEADGTFELTLPIGSAPASVACPTYANEATQIYMPVGLPM